MGVILYKASYEFKLIIKYTETEPENFRVEKHSNYNKVKTRADIYLNQKNVKSIKIIKIIKD